jgi:hypothetical protein
MKNITSCLLSIFLFASFSPAQILPEKIQKFLDGRYSSLEHGAWKQAPGACGGNKWLLTGDFNGDGRSDYLVRILTGKSRQRNLHLIGFINEKGDYTPDPFFEAEYTGDLTRSATSVLKSGTAFSAVGNGAGAALKADVVSHRVCESDTSVMYAFNNGEFKIVQDPTSLLDKFADTSSKIAQHIEQKTTPPVPTPTPTTAQSTTSDIRGIEGTYTIINADGKTDASTGTVFYKDGTLTFKISDGRAFSTATAFANNGVITTGWDRNATVSADGNTIFWTNNTKWVRK